MLNASSRVLIALLGATLALGACDKTAAPAAPAAPDSPSAPSEPTPAAPVANKPTKQAAEKPLFYKVTGSQGSLYMLGTIHVGVDPETHLPKTVWERFDASKTFVMETDLSAAQSMMLSRTVLPQGQTLKQLVGDEAWAKLDQLLDQRASQYNSMKPWVVVSLILLKMLPKGSDMSASMDQQLLNKAKAQNKTLGFLEPPELQMETLEKTMTPDDLKEMVLEFDTQKKDLDDMLSAYVKGDAATLEQISFKEKDEKPERYEMLFFSRNRAWIPTLAQALERPTDTFAAFGAGHLFGDQGVIKLLEDKGYKVERYPFSAE